MSSNQVTHTMTITETTTSAPPPKLGCNIEILMTKDGILMILEVLIAIACLSMYFRDDLSTGNIVAPLIGTILLLCFLSSAFSTFLILVSCMMSPRASNMIPKMAYGFLNNLFSCLLYFIASMIFLIVVSDSYLTDAETGTIHETVVGIMGLTNGTLYLFSAFLSFQAFNSP